MLKALARASRALADLKGQVTAFWSIHTAVLPRLGLALPVVLRKTAQAHGKNFCAVQTGNREAYRRVVIDHYEPFVRMLAASTRNARTQDPLAVDPAV